MTPEQIKAVRKHVRILAGHLGDDGTEVDQQKRLAARQEIRQLWKVSGMAAEGLRKAKEADGAAP